MRGSDIREAYLNFFAEKGHKIVPSARLVPENDPTTLFTGSGMQPILPYLLGEPHPLGTRIANSQKCFRAGDIEEVGDNRHTTFFEMLGNWSFGDYFKQEQIVWMWEFLIEKLELDPRHIYFTCFRGNEELGIPKDTESALLWQKLLLIQGIEAKIGENPETDGIREGEKIFYYSEEKNWWSRAGVPDNMPLGEPGGPDTEMFWDFGVELAFHEQSKWKDTPCHVNCDCGRFMEIGNNVFMQYKKIVTGFEELKQKNVDFGGGLERLWAAANNSSDVFHMDVFSDAKKLLEKISGKAYGQDQKETYAMRVILDHIRAATFLIGDGVSPSNKDQGYFVRRLTRRAVRFAHDLGINESFTKNVAETFIETYQEEYKTLQEKRDFILSELEKEESNFRKTLEKGLEILVKMINNLLDITLEGESYHTSKELFAKRVFDLYQENGFPLELILEELKNRNFTKFKRDEIVQIFNEEFKKHQELSRTASAGKFKGGLENSSEKTTMLHTATHLMLAGLRKYLGPDVHQAGSNITEERTRFDFTYPEKVSREILDKVEAYVNEAIAAGAIVNTVVMEKGAAEDAGVEGSFWEKYPEKVTVYQIEAPNGTVYSRELCGGPHVANTNDIAVFGRFKIIKEEASSAGVRRIKAILE